MKSDFVRSFVVSSHDLLVMQKYFTPAYYNKFLALFDIHYLHDGYHHLGRCSFYRCSVSINSATKKRIMTILNCFVYACYDAGKLNNSLGFRDYWLLMPLHKEILKLLK